MTRRTASLWPLFAILGVIFHAPVAVAQTANSESLLPVPKYAEQYKADARIREKFKAQFASHEASDRLALAHQLQDLADKETDPAAKFVLLREARESAVFAGEFPYCMAIIDDISRTFAIKTAEMKASALSVGMDMGNRPPADLANSYLKVADDALEVWNLDLASKAAYMASKLARGNPILLAEVDHRSKTVRVRNTEVLKIIAAARKLERTPDDPQLNLMVGRHQCFHMNLWENGLPFLAHSPTGPLRDLALQDLAAPATPDAMAMLADGWWDFTDVQANLPPGSGRKRAAYWYAKALPGLSGDKAAQARQRIADAAQPLR